MKSIYLDNNALIKLAENSTNSLNRKVSEISSSQHLRFAASLWNIYEIARSPTESSATSLAAFLDKLNPLWLVDISTVKNEELTRFIYNKYYKIPTDSFNPFCKTLSQVFAYSSAPDSDSIGETAESIVRSLQAYPSVLREFQESHDAIPEETQILQGKDTTRIEKEVLIRLIRMSLPINNPNNIPISEEDKSCITDFCYRYRNELYKKCPTFNVEKRLFDFRKSDKHRKRTTQDTADLQHQLQAISYCDYFITEDGYVLSGIQYVKKYIPSVNSLTTILGINQD